MRCRIVSDPAMAERLGGPLRLLWSLCLMQEYLTARFQTERSAGGVWVIVHRSRQGYHLTRYTPDGEGRSQLAALDLPHPLRPAAFCSLPKICRGGCRSHRLARGLWLGYSSPCSSWEARFLFLSYWLSRRSALLLRRILYHAGAPSTERFLPQCSPRADNRHRRRHVLSTAASRKTGSGVPFSKRFVRAPPFSLLRSFRLSCARVHTLLSGTISISLVD